MVAEVISTEIVDASAGNGSTNVTVPADCTAIAVMGTQYSAAGNQSLASLTLSAVAFTRNQLAQNGDRSGTFVAYLISPGTGSLTLAWTWTTNTPRLVGGFLVVVYVKGINVADAVRDTDRAHNIDANNVTIALDSSLTDLVLGFAMAGGAPGNHPALTSPASLLYENQANGGDQTFDVGVMTPGASSTAIDMTNEAYSSVCGIAFKAAAAGFAHSYGAAMG